MLPTMFQVNRPIASGDKAKHRISRWAPRWPFWISDQNNFIFDLHVTPMLPTKFQVNWPFGSGEEGKIDFQDGRSSHLGFRIETI